MLQCCHKAKWNVNNSETAADIQTSPLMCVLPLVFSFGIRFFIPQNSTPFNLGFLSVNMILSNLSVPEVLLFCHPLSSAVLSIYSPAHFDLCYASTTRSFSSELNRIIFCKKKKKMLSPIIWAILILCITDLVSLKVSFFFSEEFSSEIFR